MNAINVGLKLRPIKIAFLVEPGDTKALKEALEVNSILWGGMYNPIIPVFTKKPAVWVKNDPISKYKSKDVIKGYVDAYNPDFLVLLGKCSKKKFDYLDRKIITKEEILKKLNTEGTPGYGVGIFEVLRNFCDEELKFVRRHPIDFHSFNYTKNANFFSAIFGVLPKDVNKTIKESWDTFMQTKVEVVNLSNYADFLDPKYIFIRRVMQRKIEATGKRENCLFFMDADSNHDIIDYWNLRALGWTVIPIAKQSASFDSVKKMATDFIEEHSGTHRHNKNYYIRATVMKSRSVSEEELKTFATSLTIKVDSESNGSRWVFQHWYPRIWDEWARDKDQAICCELSVKTADHSFPITEDKLISVKQLDIDFAERFGGDGTPRYANVVDVKIYDNNDIYAEAIPEAGKELTRTLSGMGLSDWRFSASESIYYVTHTKSQIHLSLPKAEEVFTAWMKDNKFDIKLSPSGRIAKQITKQLGGLWSLGILANENLIQLLQDMQDAKITQLSAQLKKADVKKTEDLIDRISSMQVGKEINKEHFMAKMSQIANSQVYKSEPVEMLKRYMDRQMFRLGATIKCPICMHSSWYTVEQLKYKITCTKCLDEYDLPSHSADEIKWAYRTFGPFSLSGSAEGAYTTILTLRVFSKVFDIPVTPAFSFLTKINNKEKEIDLGLIVKQSKYWRHGETRVVFAECKSYNNFEKSDVEKMDQLASKFPGSVIVFATLKDSLTKKEQKLLKPLVTKCRKYWKAEQPYNPVLILTKTELFSNHDFRYAWENGTQAQKDIALNARNDFYGDRIINACDKTQQLYLGMKPWQEEQWEKYENRRKKMTTKPITP